MMPQLKISTDTSDKTDNKVLTTIEVSKIRRCLPQIIATCIKNVLLLVYGLSLGMPTMLIPSLSGKVPGEDILLDESGISWIGSINYLSVPIGCMVSGAVTQPMGRIRSMQAMCLMFCGALLCFYFATSAWHIFLGLFLTGFTGGLLEAPTLIYTVEITEPGLRGSLSSTSTLFIVMGIIVSFVLGTVSSSWRIMALINACIPLAGLFLLMIIPESPYWLISRNRKDEAKKCLAWLRGWTTEESVEQEFLRICSELKQKDIDDHKSSKSTSSFINIETIKQYFKGTFIKPFLLINLTFVLAHFTTTPVNIYAVNIFAVLKVPMDAYYATILIGAIELIGCIVLMILVRFVGKRILTFISLIGIFVNLLFAGIYSYAIGVHNFDSTDSIATDIAEKYNWVPLATIIAMGFFSYTMTYSLPWIIMGELFPNEVRDTGSGMSAATGYLIGFVANKTFLNLVNFITLPGVFWFYSCVAILGVILLYFLLPETEGKTLFEITEHYAGNGKLNNKVSRVGMGKHVSGVINEGFEGKEGTDLDTHL